MTNAATTIEAVATTADNRSQGLGTVSFVLDSTECFGRITANDTTETVRGSYSGVLAVLKSKSFQVTLERVATPSAKGPVARGLVVNTTTGETFAVAMWATSKSAYGLTLEKPIAPQATHKPW